MKVTDVTRSTPFRLLFLGTLGIGLFYGVNWATDAEELGDPLPRSVREGESRQIVADPPVSETPAPEPTATESPTVSASPTVESTPAEVLIAAARPPAETSVQVLDAGGGAARTRDAAERAEALGYQVVSVTSARVSVAGTTVWFTDGNEAEAMALRARDERFREIEPNRGLSEGVDLHVLVAEDWT